MTGSGRVIAVARDGAHRFGKIVQQEIVLVAGLGVAGDAHFGATVKHRSRAAKTPEAPNLRQVHLMQGELLTELDAAGFEVAPGGMGENVTTHGIDLLGLPRHIHMRLGSTAVIEVTGLRNPCRQIDENVGKGAMAATLAKADDGSLIRRAGIMATVVTGGSVRPGDTIDIVGWPERIEPLRPV